MPKPRERLNVSVLQVEEWLKSPVTAAIVRLLDDRARSLHDLRAQTLVRGEPYRTHETLLDLAARQAENDGLADLLTTPTMLIREFEQSEEIVIHGEYERYLAGGLSGAGETGPH